MSDKMNLYAVWAIAICFCLIIVYLSARYYYVNQSNCYTIGAEIFNTPGPNGSSYDYKIIVNKIVYSGSIGHESYGKNPEYGKRYLVKFVEWYPSWNYMLVEKPIPDSIQEVPKNGWIGIPEFCNR